MTLIGIQLVYADFHTAATNMMMTVYDTLKKPIIHYFHKINTSATNLHCICGILYRKDQKIPSLFDVLHSIKGPNFPYKIPSD